MMYPKLLLLTLLMSFTIHSYGQRTLSQVINETPGTAPKDITIMAGENVEVDGPADVGVLTINGRLSCKSLQAEIKAQTIYVNGIFECGTSAVPYNGKFIISLKSSAIDPTPFQGYPFRGLIVNPNGKLWLYGNTDRAGHYKLGATAKIGDSSVVVDRDVSKWKPNDEIVITSSSYNLADAETFRISRVEGNVVYLFNAAFKKQHWGERQSFINQNNAAVTLDERAEIANLTRSIVIRPEETATTLISNDGNLDFNGVRQPITAISGQLGGHVMVHGGASGIGEAKIDAVEFSRMGQAGIMARYPFHWHKLKDAPGQFIKNSSIHRSFQRCLTIHQTNKVIVENNVCFNFKGHGFFLEDGNEVDNVITKNLGINALRPHPHRVLLSSDNYISSVSGVTPKRFPATSVFWISNPKNIVNYNIAAGSEGVGFWNSFVGGNPQNYISDLKAFNYATKEFDGEILLVKPPVKTSTSDFSYNIAHSTLVGHTWDGSPNQFAPGINGYKPNSINNILNPMDRRLESANYSPDTTPVFKGLVAYKNIHTGIYFRGDTAIFDGAITADNGWHWFLAFNQVVRNTLVVGRSQNHTPADITYLKTKTSWEYQVGLIMYDGPFELDNVDFVNFGQTLPNSAEFDAVPIMTIGGNDKYYNLTKKVKFSPEPYHRVVMESQQKVGGSYWLDETLTNNIRDTDGTLTGVTGGILIPDNEFTKSARCFQKNMGTTPSFKGFVVCPADYKVTTYWLASSNTGQFTPFVMRRSDGKVSLPKDQWGLFDLVGKNGVDGPSVMNLKLMLPSSEGYSYDMMLTPNSIANGKGYERAFTRMYAESANVANPALRILNAGYNCRLTNGKKYLSLLDLGRGTESGYFTSGNDFHLRMITRSGVLQVIDASTLQSARTSESSTYYIACDGPVKSRVTGHIDGVALVNGAAQITGWACDYGVSNPIDIQVFAGGSSGTGKLLGKMTASENSEVGVNFSCADATMTSHRFTFSVPSDQLKTFGNQAIYIHGVSATGGTNSTLTNSGNFRLPAGTTTTAALNCSFNGQTIASGSSVVAYQVMMGATCLSEQRTCLNGVLSGSYSYSTCSPVTITYPFTGFRL